MLGAVPLNGGSANYTTASLAEGIHSITATYSGNTDYLPVSNNAAALTRTVIDFALTPTGSSGASQTVVPGSSATYQVPITPTSGASFPTAAILTVTGLPAEATATLNTTPWTVLSATSWQVPAGTTLGTVSLTFKIPGQSAAVRPAPRQGSKIPPVVWAVLLIPFARKLRRSGRKMARFIALLLVLATGSATIAGVSGCTAYNGYFGQMQQAYPITVTLTTGLLSHSTNLTLTVQ